MESSESFCWRRRRGFLALLVLALLGLHALVLVRAEEGRRSLYSGLGDGSGHGVLPLRHKYADRAGSSFRGRGKGMTREHHHLLRQHDRARRLRLLAEVVDFPLGGKPDPDADGLYYTSLSLGSPPQKFYLQVDTGSDLMWVNCAPCYSCPSGASTLGFELQQYDPVRSSDSSVVSCTDVMCKNLLGNPSCSINECDYQLEYADGSQTSGRLVKDSLTYTQLVDSAEQNATANIVFGCGYSQTGDLASSRRAVDGIIGFGQSSISVSSQLYAEGKSPNIFAHCLEGEGKGGGLMVLGAVNDTDLVYTPMVPKQPHYNVNLQSIAVGGVNLSIPTSAFATDSSNGAGTIFDSGTTLALFSTQSYQPTYKAILDKTSDEVRPQPYETFDCFIVPSGGAIGDYFPNLTLYFSGAAAMHLTPENYLFKLEGVSWSNFWCWGWATSSDQPGLTILGDIVLKDRVVEYDNVQKRIGWADYNCSSPIIASADHGPQTVNPSSLTNGNRGIQLAAGQMGVWISLIMAGYLALLH